MFDCLDLSLALIPDVVSCANRGLFFVNRFPIPRGKHIADQEILIGIPVSLDGLTGFIISAISWKQCNKHGVTLPYAIELFIPNISPNGLVKIGSEKTWFWLSFILSQ
jgi:hypothetical protein